VSKRLTFFACALMLLSAACSAPPKGTISLGTGTEFVPMVADSIDNVGAGDAIAVDAKGVAYVSYWGFPAKVVPGQIPVSRPVGAPILTTATLDPASAVLVASFENGIFTRGAAAMPIDAPAGVTIPFGPTTIDSLVDGTPANTNGTDIAVASDGIFADVDTLSDLARLKARTGSDR